MEVSASLRHHNDIITSVQFTDCGNYCFTSSVDRTVALWKPRLSNSETTKKKEISPLHCYNPAHNSAVNCISVSPDNHQFVSGGDDRKLHLWDISEGKVLRTFQRTSAIGGHTESIRNCCYMRSNPRVALSGSKDKNVFGWDLRIRGGPVMKLSDARDTITGVSTDRGDHNIFTTSLDGSLRVYDIRGKINEDGNRIKDADRRLKKGVVNGEGANQNQNVLHEMNFGSQNSITGIHIVEDYVLLSIVPDTVIILLKGKGAVETPYTVSRVFSGNHRHRNTLLRGVVDIFSSSIICPDESEIRQNIMSISFYDMKKDGIVFPGGVIGDSSFINKKTSQETHRVPIIDNHFPRVTSIGVPENRSVKGCTVVGCTNGQVFSLENGSHFWNVNRMPCCSFTRPSAKSRRTQSDTEKYISRECLRCHFGHSTPYDCSVFVCDRCGCVNRAVSVKLVGGDDPLNHPMVRRFTHVDISSGVKITTLALSDVPVYDPRNSRNSIDNREEDEAVSDSLNDSLPGESLNVIPPLRYAIPSCSVCLEASGDCMLQPCLHGGLCESCARHIAGNRAVGGNHCPVCRTQISDVLRVCTITSTTIAAAYLRPEDETGIPNHPISARIPRIPPISYDIEKKSRK